MKVLVIGDSEFSIRGLKRGELKALKADGIEPLELDAELPEDELESKTDRIFQAGCPDVDPDDVTPGEYLKITTAIIEETYLLGDVSKNLPKPPENGSPDGKKIAKSARKQGSKRKGGAR